MNTGATIEPAKQAKPVPALSCLCQLSALSPARHYLPQKTKMNNLINLSLATPDVCRRPELTAGLNSGKGTPFFPRRSSCGFSPLSHGLATGPANGGEGIQFNTVLEEVSHFLACCHFGINAEPRVFSESQRASNGQWVAGECAIDQLTRCTRYQESVIGWAGALGTVIAGETSSLGAMPFPLNQGTLKFWYRVAMYRLEMQSLNDQRLICGYKQTWVSFKAAYRILSKQKKTLLLLARLMMESLQQTEADVSKFEPWPTTKIPPRLSPEFRAQKLKEFLDRLDLDDPQRHKFEPMLAALSAGREPGPEFENENKPPTRNL